VRLDQDAGQTQDMSRTAGAHGNSRLGAKANPGKSIHTHAETLILTPNQAVVESRISTFMASLTTQSQYKSVISVLSTAIPRSQVDSMLSNGIQLSEAYLTTQSWYTSLPKDLKAYASSAASQATKLGQMSTSANSAPVETGAWKMGVVGAAGAVAGLAWL
jgi:hypothetical protein